MQLSRLAPGRPLKSIHDARSPKARSQHIGSASSSVEHGFRSWLLPKCRTTQQRRTKPSHRNHVCRASQALGDDERLPLFRSSGGAIDVMRMSL